MTTDEVGVIVRVQIKKVSDLIMALKRLNEFMTFDIARFMKGKTLAYMNATEWVKRDYVDGKVVDGSEKVMGTVVTVLIKEDNTEYAKEDVNNLSAQFDVKVPGKKPSDYANMQMFLTDVMITEVQKANIWGKGQMKDELSIEANVISVEDYKKLVAQKQAQQRQ